MPRRGGIFGRIADWFRGTPKHVPPPEREDVPQYSEPLRPLPSYDEHESHMRSIFNDTAGGYNYGEWREIYDPISEVFRYHETNAEDDEEIEQYWDEFLRAYYLTTHDAGYIPREQFHQDTGIPPSEVDWDLWRNIKRGTP